MSLQSELTLGFQRIAQEINALRAERGALTALTTTDKTSIVAAINEVQAALGATNSTALIDDASTSATDKTLSVAEIGARLQTAIDNLLDGAPTALDTLNELAAAITANDGDIAGILTSIGNRVRFDAVQSLTTAQKTQARSNIDAVGVADVGDTARDFTADFTGALT